MYGTDFSKVGNRKCSKCGDLYKNHDIAHHGNFICKIRACIAGEAKICFKECRFYNKKNPSLCFKLNPHLRE